MAGQPAARVGDTTAHGGVITTGSPNVFINGRPAARMGDMHVCPLCSPSPHVGGPIATGAPTVFINGQPAARVGDVCTCAGPPDAIVTGSSNVFIGGGGGGASQGGQQGVTAAKMAIAAAAGPAVGVEREPVGHWVAVGARDERGRPVSTPRYRLKDTAGEERSGRLNRQAMVWRDGLEKEGECEVSFVSVWGAKWSVREAAVGEEVGYKASVAGIEEGDKVVVQIVRREVEGGEVVVEECRASVTGGKVEGAWTFAWDYEEEASEASASTDGGAPLAYRSPMYFLRVLAGAGDDPVVTRSGLLRYRANVEFQYVSEDTGEPIPDARYVFRLSNGEVRRGRTNQNGWGYEEEVPPVDHVIDFLD